MTTDANHGATEATPDDPTVANREATEATPDELLAEAGATDAPLHDPTDATPVDPTDATLADLLARAEAWLADDPDPATRDELRGGDRGRPGRRRGGRRRPGRPLRRHAPVRDRRPARHRWGPARTG